MDTFTLKNSVITYHAPSSPDRYDHLQIGGFNPAKSSGLFFEKIDPQYGEVIGVMNEKELDLVLRHYSYTNVESTKDTVAAIRQAYNEAAQNNFLTVQVYEAIGHSFTALSMQKDGHYYRGVLGDTHDSFLVDGRVMSGEEKYDLFYKAQSVLGDKGMQKFGLTSYRNQVIDGSRQIVASGTVMDNALNPMHYLGAECAVPVRED